MTEEQVWQKIKDKVTNDPDHCRELELIEIFRKIFPDQRLCTDLMGEYFIYGCKTDQDDRETS